MENTNPGTIRVGLVGAGFAGGIHVECLQRVHGVDVEIAGVTSATPGSREKFGRKHGIKAYDCIESMLGDIDVLSICSPPYAHAEAIIRAAEAGKGIICEKPLTGYFGPQDAGASYRGDREDKERMLDYVMQALAKIKDAVQQNGIFFGYAENFIYTPALQKEREIIEKSDAQVLRMIGEESHSGSSSPVYGIWRYAGGGSLVGKGVHPLGAVLYLKRVEGMVRHQQPIRPVSVSARTHQLTRIEDYADRGFLRTDYHDVEDYGFIHVVFEDGTVADVITSEVVLGGLYDYVEVFANNHRTRCNISPVKVVDTYNPSGRQYEDIYLVEKCSTKEGWSGVATDENFTVGYQAEMQDFMECACRGGRPASDIDLALDVTAAAYAAYLSDQNRGGEIGVPLL